MEKFSRRLNQACDLAGLPPMNKGRQTELAKIMSVSNEAVSKWFADESQPHRDKLDKLAKSLKVDPVWLAMGIGEPTNSNVSQINFALIDQFAFHALKAILSSNPNIDEKTLAQKAYSIAKHMLNERGL